MSGSPLAETAHTATAVHQCDALLAIWQLVVQAGERPRAQADMLGAQRTISLGLSVPMLARY